MSDSEGAESDICTDDEGNCTNLSVSPGNISGFSELPTAVLVNFEGEAVTDWFSVLSYSCFIIVKYDLLGNSLV